MIRRFLKFIIIISIIALVIYMFSKEFFKLYVLYQENEDIKRSISDLKKENQDLQKQISILTSDTAYLQKIAREELGMIKQSEKIFKFQQ
ncbi:MAG: FtsB family cell division protein [Thermodesulfobacteriota bacterium]